MYNQVGTLPKKNVYVFMFCLLPCLCNVTNGLIVIEPKTNLLNLFTCVTFLGSLGQAPSYQIRLRPPWYTYLFSAFCSPGVSWIFLFAGFALELLFDSVSVEVILKTFASQNATQVNPLDRNTCHLIHLDPPRST